MFLGVFSALEQWVGWDMYPGLRLFSPSSEELNSGHFLQLRGFAGMQSAIGQTTESVFICIQPADLEIRRAGSDSKVCRPRTSGTQLVIFLFNSWLLKTSLCSPQ